MRNIDNEGYDVSLSQTLFNLSAWFGWRAGKETSRQAEANLAAAQQDLIVRVVQAYFAVLRAQDNLRASQAQERAFERQLEQTRQRFEVGLIAITDVYEAEAARDLAQVTRIVDENNVAVAKENLSVLTGQAPGTLYACGRALCGRGRASKCHLLQDGARTDGHRDLSLSRYRNDWQHRSKPP